MECVQLLPGRQLVLYEIMVCGFGVDCVAFTFFFSGVIQAGERLAEGMGFAYKLCEKLS